jgi:hypothetical protein
VPHGRYDISYRRIGFSVINRCGVLASAATPDSVVVRLPENHMHIHQIIVKDRLDSSPERP